MNAIVIISGGEAVTTTLAIAEGTELDHASVIKLVRTYQPDLEEFGRVGFEIAPFETAGGTQQREIATLNEQQSTLIMTYMRNSEIVRMFKKRLVKAFWELAKRPAVDPMKVLSDPAAMRGLLLGYTEKVIELENKVAIIQPKSDALDRIATHSEGSHCIRDAAAILQVREKALYSLLSEAGWIYKRPTGSGWLAYGPVRAKMLMEHKVTVGQKEDGSEWKTEQPRITARGMAKIALMIESGQLQGMAA